MIAQEFLQYTVIDKIGEGAMGVIYKARDKKLDRLVALKFLPPHLVSDIHCRERLIREAQAAARLNHPNLVTIYEINQVEDLLFIAMEYVQGVMLHERLRVKQLGDGVVASPHPGEALDYILFLAGQICAGLKHAHDEGIIHRDIKPQNILVNREDRLKILDFGLAKGKQFKSITDKYSTLGTLFYLSPEQLNSEEIDTRTDIWSLGVLFYTMLAGRLPFPGERAEEVITRIMEMDPEPIAYPEDRRVGRFFSLIASMLMKNREERIGRIDEIQRNLELIGENRDDPEIETDPGIRERIANTTVKASTDQQAFKWYLKGRFYWSKRYEGGLKQALTCFEEAVEKDATFYLPLVGMADTYNLMGFFGFSPPAKSWELADTAAHKALALAPQAAEIQASLGWIETFFAWNWEAAESRFRQAMALNPEYPWTFEWYSLFLAAMGRKSEAMAMVDKALAIEPLSPIINATLAFILLLDRRYPEARDLLLKILEMDTDLALVHIWLGETYLFENRFDKAAASFLHALEHDPQMTYPLADLGYTYGRMGLEGEAESVLRHLEKISRNRYLAKIQHAQVHLGLNDLNRFFLLVSEAIEEHEPFAVWLREHPHYDTIRSDPRYTTLIETIGFVR